MLNYRVTTLLLLLCCTLSRKLLQIAILLEHYTIESVCVCVRESVCVREYTIGRHMSSVQHSHPWTGEETGQ